MSKGLKKQLLNLLFVAILIGITVTVLFVNNKELNFQNIGAFFANCNPYWMTAAFCCMLLFIVFEGLSVHLIARRLGHKGKLISSLAYSSADVYYSAITPSASGGQPASAYYMVRDGMGAGKATFTLVFNLIGYTAAILVIGLIAFILRPTMFTQIESWFVHFLMIAGAVVQILLLAFFIACMFCGKAVLKLGNGLISLLVKIKLVKKPDKWRKKLSDEVEKYASCLGVIKNSPFLFLGTLGWNVLQRVSQTLIPCFVCLAAGVGVSCIDLFVMQVYVLIGYNCVPLPGGVGAYEYLYLNIYCLHFDRAFILNAMMISRLISYYVCIAVSGLFTLIYHLTGIRQKKSEQKTEETPEEGN